MSIQHLKLKSMNVVWKTNYTLCFSRLKWSSNQSKLEFLKVLDNNLDDLNCCKWKVKYWVHYKISSVCRRKKNSQATRKFPHLSNYEFNFILIAINFPSRERWLEHGGRIGNTFHNTVSAIHKSRMSFQINLDTFMSTPPRIEEGKVNPILEPLCLNSLLAIRKACTSCIKGYFLYCLRNGLSFTSRLVLARG